MTTADIDIQPTELGGYDAWECTGKVGRYFELAAAVSASVDHPALASRLDVFARRLEGLIDTYGLKFSDGGKDERGALVQNLRTNPEVESRMLFCYGVADGEPTDNRTRRYLLSFSPNVFSDDDRFLTSVCHEVGHQLLFENSTWFGRYAPRSNWGRCSFDFPQGFSEAFADWIMYVLTGETESTRESGIVDRSIDNQSSYPDMKEREAHQLSQVFSGILFDLAKEISPDAVTRILSRSLPVLDAAFMRAGEATGPTHWFESMVAADRSLFEGVHVRLLEKLFAGRGIPTRHEAPAAADSGQRAIELQHPGIVISSGDLFDIGTYELGPRDSLNRIQRQYLFMLASELGSRVVVDHDGNPHRMVLDLKANSTEHIAGKRGFRSLHDGMSRGVYHVRISAAALNENDVCVRPVADLKVSAVDFDQPAHLDLQPHEDGPVFDALVEAFKARIGSRWPEYLSIGDG